MISAEAVTFVMSVFFLVAGLYQLFASMWSHLPGWGWHFFANYADRVAGTNLTPAVVVLSRVFLDAHVIDIVSVRVDHTVSGHIPHFVR